MNEKLQAKLLITCLDDIIDNAQKMRDGLRLFIDNTLNEGELPESHLSDLDAGLYAFPDLRNKWAEAAEVNTNDIVIEFVGNARFHEAGNPNFAD